MPNTPNLNLLLYAAHAAPWDTGTNNNWTLVDTFAATCVIKSPAAGQTLTQPASTYFSINGLQIFGSSPVPTIFFAPSAGNYSGSISLPSSGVFSADATAPGNGDAQFKADIFNAKTGFRLNSLAPLNHFLIGNGTNYVDSASLPTGLVWYQTVQTIGTPQNQRGVLNFLSSFTVADNIPNGSTDVSLATTGVTAGAYTNASITVTADGRLTVAASGTPTTYNPVYHDVTGSRAFSTVYQNTTGQTMRVYGFGATTGSTVGSTEARVNSTGTLTQTTNTIWATTEGATVTSGTLGFTFEVQNNWFYAVYANTFTNGMGSGVTGLGKWIEVY